MYIRETLLDVTVVDLIAAILNESTVSFEYYLYQAFCLFYTVSRKKENNSIS